jgi:hypothetical protein
MKNNKEEKYEKEHIGSDGNIYVYLKDKKGKYHKHMTAQLVLETFVGPQPSQEHKPFHKDGNKTNNRVDNLEWKIYD